MNIENVYKDLIAYSKFKFINQIDREDFVQDAIMKILRNPSRLNFKNLYCDFFRENFINYRAKSIKQLEAFRNAYEFKDDIYAYRVNFLKSLIIYDARKRLKHEVELYVFDKILVGYSIKDIAKQKKCSSSYISQVFKKVLTQL